MPQKPAIRKTYRTANGKIVDMDLLRQKNELVPAVGNVRVNARGDELGPGGKIIRKREDILKEFYDNADKRAAQAHIESEKEIEIETKIEDIVDEEEKEKQ